LAGKIFEFANRPSVVQLYGTGSAAGLRISLLIGNEVVVDDQEISPANRFPLLPDDFIGRGGAMQGDRILVSLRNTTVGAIVAQTRVDMEPVS